MSQPVYVSREQFAEWVHDALNHLYDSAYLEVHPLAELVLAGETDVVPRSQSLRRVLLNAIHMLRPTAGTPAQSADWRTYHILQLRYLEGRSPHEVMNRVALAKTQFFREQTRVVDALTAILWTQWEGQTGTPPPAPESRSAGAGDAPFQNLARAEVAQLRTQASWETIDIEPLLETLIDIVRPLATTKGVTVDFGTIRGLYVVHADRVMLRQAILNVISYALDVAAGGSLSVERYEGPSEVGVGICARPSPDARSSKTDHGDNRAAQGDVRLAVCQDLVSAMGGRLQTSSDTGQTWEASLVWPISEPPTLLVIDDNATFADLVRRYVASTYWQVVRACSGVEARRVLSEIRPTMILLDVMIPREDGWELLRALKADPHTQGIPIIICSVLNEPTLALTLGAAGFLPKPLSQQALLRILFPWRSQGPTQAPAN